MLSLRSLTFETAITTEIARTTMQNDMSGFRDFTGVSPSVRLPK
jgi:hypothetical protein